MKICIIWDWDTPVEDILNTNDGVLATYAELAKKVEVQVFTGWPGGEGARYLTKGNLAFTLFGGLDKARSFNGFLERFNPDYIFCWGSLDRPWWKLIQRYLPQIPKGIRFSGGPHDYEERKWFDHIFCESPSDAQAFRELGHTNIIEASACDVDTFRPRKTPRLFKAIYPTSFCEHKRIEIFADSFSGDGLVCGRWNEPKLVSYCKARQVHAWPRIPSETLSYLYGSSQYAALTGGLNSGGQRMVLEAMACNVQPIIAADNLRCRSYIEESGFGHIVEPQNFSNLELPDQKDIGRDYVLAHYTPEKFADKILETAESCMETVHG